MDESGDILLWDSVPGKDAKKKNLKSCLQRFIEDKEKKRTEGKPQRKVGHSKEGNGSEGWGAEFLRQGYLHNPRDC